LGGYGVVVVVVVADNVRDLAVVYSSSETRVVVMKSDLIIEDGGLAIVSNVNVTFNEFLDPDWCILETLRADSLAVRSRGSV
jgi:hypothetical protein